MTTYQGILLDEGGAVFNVKAYSGPQPAHAALAAATAAGRGVVYFPPGIYTIDSPLIIEGNSDIALIGAGPNATQLVQNNDQGVVVIRDSANAASSRIRIQGFWIGISAAPVRAGGVGIRVTSATEYGASVVTIKDIELMNVPHPLVVDNVHQSAF